MWVPYDFSQMSQPVHHHAPPLILGRPAKLHCLTVNSDCLPSFPIKLCPHLLGSLSHRLHDLLKEIKVGNSVLNGGDLMGIYPTNILYDGDTMVILVMCGDGHWKTIASSKLQEKHQIIPVRESPWKII